MRWAVGHGHLHIITPLLEEVDRVDSAFEWTKPKRPHSSISEGLFDGGCDQRFGSVQQKPYKSTCSSPYHAAFLGHHHIIQRRARNWNHINERDDLGRKA